ncbi:long-chain-fatty-acid--CoA ligase-like [Dermatophagoides farinae]|uniref:long-chain-fatty-acid--CoA ligase-like n=1 Tax=Dermatophagoides farinae TaxID=6954 RepID=UPI003F5F41D3
MALNDKVRKDWKLVTNTEIFEGYGMSETTGLISCQRPILHEDNDKFSLSIEEQQISSVGKIIPNCSVKIIPIQDKIEYTNNENAPISSKEIGEICVKGPIVTKEYRTKSDKKNYYTEDGYFRTGDIGYLNDDILYLQGRIKNIVIISGFNVYPAEIEKVVRNCPKVNDCVVIGKTDKNNIEYLYMLVEKDIDANLTEQEVKQYCADNLAPYKRPKVIEITVSLPRTPIGKVSLSDL